MATCATCRTADFGLYSRDIVRNFCCGSEPTDEAARENSICLFLYREESAGKSRDNYSCRLAAKN